MKYLIAIALIVGNIIFPQENAYVYGNIIDAETREPIAYANIFIANSSIGTASDKEGYFELRHLQLGRYEIIASVIGYELLKADLHIYNNDTRNLRFELYKEPLKFPEVVVTGKESRKRKKQMEKFRKNFLGTSQNAEETYIKNEEVIRFNDGKYGKLRAFAVEPLEIVNNSLGYNITYVLDEFEMADEYVKYIGYPYFYPKIVKSYYDSVEWCENRELTYLGSLRHFLTTICENYGIIHRNIGERVTAFHLNDILEHGVKVTYGDTTIIEDEGFYVLRLYYPLGEQKAGVRELVNINKFLSETNNENELQLSFPDFLEIKYDNDFFPFENKKGNIKTSWIIMTCDSTVLDKEGRYYNKYAIKTKGVWSKERVADMLPFDYKIGKE